jgi:hypothetical protein
MARLEARQVSHRALCRFAVRLLLPAYISISIEHLPIMIPNGNVAVDVLRKTVFFSRTGMASIWCAPHRGEFANKVANKVLNRDFGRNAVMERLHPAAFLDGRVSRAGQGRQRACLHAGHKKQGDASEGRRRPARRGRAPTVKIHARIRLIVILALVVMHQFELLVGVKLLPCTHGWLRR